MSKTLGVFRTRASDLFKLQTGGRTALGWTYRTSEILGYAVSRRWRCESSNLVIPCGVAEGRGVLFFSFSHNTT